MDFIFRENTEDNYLEQHRHDMMKQEREQELAKLEAMKSKRSQMYNWNYQNEMEKELGLADDSVNINFNSKQGSGVAPKVQEEQKEMHQQESPKSNAFSENDDDTETLARERAKMLALIAMNKKAVPRDVIKPRTETDILSGLGDGIIKDLETSIAVEPSKAIATETIQTQHAKSVKFREEESVIESATSTARDHFPPAAIHERKSSSTSDEPNKLAELNNLLKGGGPPDFAIKQEDENEFDAFLKKLAKQREDEKPVQKSPVLSNRSIERAPIVDSKALNSDRNNSSGSDDEDITRAEPAQV